MRRKPLPGGRKWSDYEELGFAVSHPGWHSRDAVPNDVAAFFLQSGSASMDDGISMDDGMIFRANGKVYIRKDVWVGGSRRSKESLRQTLDHIADQKGCSEGTAAAWIVTQELSSKAPFHKFMQADTLHGEACTRMILAFVGHLQELGHA